MTTSSPAAGLLPSNQFPAVDQLLLTPPFCQVFVAAKAGEQMNKNAEIKMNFFKVLRQLSGLLTVALF